jgi:hypothetical protein
MSVWTCRDLLFDGVTSDGEADGDGGIPPPAAEQTGLAALCRPPEPAAPKPAAPQPGSKPKAVPQRQVAVEQMRLLRRLLLVEESAMEHDIKRCVCVIDRHVLGLVLICTLRDCDTAPSVLETDRKRCASRTVASAVLHY